MVFQAYSATDIQNLVHYVKKLRRKKRASLYAAGITQKLNGFNN